MWRVAAVAVLLAAGCSDPRLNAGVSIGAHGVSVTPGLSARVGGLGVRVGP